jgi:hypothetical protein
MRMFRVPLFYLILAASTLMLGPVPASAQIGASITVAPPGLPIYSQPLIPSVGYIWTPGFWAYGPYGYYWVPGTWVLPPAVGLLWTPGYWGWVNDAYVWNTGYWGPQVGFYGGVNYGFGYTGSGYDGGYWNNGALYYNRAANNIGGTNITNVYTKNINVNQSVTNIAYNGGPGGVRAQPTPAEVAASHEHRIPPTSVQVQQPCTVGLGEPRPSADCRHRQTRRIYRIWGRRGAWRAGKSGRTAATHWAARSPAERGGAACGCGAAGTGAGRSGASGRAACGAGAARTGANRSGAFGRAACGSGAAGADASCSGASGGAACASGAPGTDAICSGAPGTATRSPAARGTGARCPGAAGDATRGTGPAGTRRATARHSAATPGAAARSPAAASRPTSAGAAPCGKGTSALS